MTVEKYKTLEKLKNNYDTLPSVDVLEAIIQLGDDRQSARDWYVKHLERQPSLLAASRWIAGERFENEQPHKLVQRALDQATKPLMRYRCAACGFDSTLFVGAGCGAGAEEFRCLAGNDDACGTASAIALTGLNASRLTLLLGANHARRACRRRYHGKHVTILT
jgi:hypothetical protein